MHILTIIPIARGIPFDTLSYYAIADTASGTIVTIPFGRQTISGIVVESVSLADAKTFVKQANFALKKIKSATGTIPILSASAKALKETSQLTLIPIGAIAGNVIPQTLLEYSAATQAPASITTSKPQSDISETEMPTLAGTEEPAESVVYGMHADRLDQYKRQIRSCFAEKNSVLFIAPTIRSLHQWHDELQRGIGKHTVMLHSKITKKELKAAYTTIKNSEYPLIIFATPAFCIAPRADLGCIIAEDESSSLYKTSDRFALDTRVFIRQFAMHAQLALIWGDIIPRFETLSRLDAEQLPRTLLPEQCTVVPIEHYRSVLPKEVRETLVHAFKHGKRVYIHSARKGIAPLSRCADCGTVVACPNCELPMVLRAKITRTADGSKERTFLCTHCATTLPTTHTCTNCLSWNITPVPIGTESLRDAVRALLGESATIITIDDDMTPDAAKAQQLIDSIDKQKSAVIIGTIKVLPFLKDMHYSLFPFIDRLLSVPSLYTTEQVLRLIMQCSEHSSDGVVLFTQRPEFPFLSQLATYKINAIVQDELTVRRELGYPPFGALVKITITIPDQQRTAITDRVTDYLERHESSMLRARRVDQSNKIQLSWAIKGATTFIEEHGAELSLFLSSLRYPYTIEENPEML